MRIYRSAQAEAGMEADWFFIQGPESCGVEAASAGRAACVEQGGGEVAGGQTVTRDPAAGPPAVVGKAMGSSDELMDIKTECLHILSRALQQPGTRSLAAELSSPSHGDNICEMLGEKPCCGSPQEALRECSAPLAIRSTRL